MTPLENPFVDKQAPPTDESLADVLGRTKRHWDAILGHVASDCEGVTQKWMFYGAKYGWTLKLLRKKRAVLYMAPKAGTFTASMALRDAGVAALRDTNLPPVFVAEIENAKPFPEGQPARLDVTNLKHVAMIKTLIGVKLQG